MKTIERFWGYLGKRWPGYLLGGLYNIFREAALQIVFALLLKYLVDASLAGDSKLLLASILTVAIILAGLTALIPLSRRNLIGALEQATLNLRMDLFSHMQDLPMAYHEKTHTADLVARLTGDLDQAKEAMGEHLFNLLALGVTMATAIVFLGLIHWKLLVLALLLTLLPILINRYTAASMRRASSALQAGEAELSGLLKDFITGIPVLRSFNLEGHFAGDYQKANLKVRGLADDLAIKQSINVMGNNLFGSATFLAMLGFGGYLITRGELTLGQTVAAVQLCNGISNPLNRLGPLWVNLQRSLGAADRVFALLDQEEESLGHAKAGDDSDPAAGPADSEMVFFKDVDFSYDEGNLILRGLDLAVKRGSLVALAGPSGGGKSTIFKLLLGFYPATGGDCYLAGQRLNHYNLADLRRQIAFVPQEAYLFSGTIYDNIAYGKADAREDEIYAAANAANAHDFIMEMPQGYKTPVGERGAQLSGGQGQRLAIARALLKDAPLLLLDEATASLDSHAESLVQEALQQLMQGRTTLMIAHRLATIEKADCIFVIDEGRVVEAGTHAELLRADGLYRRLFMSG